MLKQFNELILSGNDLTNTQKVVLLIALKLAEIVFVIILFVVIARIAMYINHRAMRKRSLMNEARSTTIASIIDDIIKYLCNIIAFLAILPILGIDTKTILASSGVIAIVISVGGASFITDFINGFFALFEGYYDVGDFVRINNFEGNIEEIGLKTTVLKSMNNEFIAIPNSTIVEVVNLSKYSYVQYPVASFSYADDIDYVKDTVVPIIVENIKNDPRIINIEYLGVCELAESSVNIKFELTSTESNRFHAEREFFYQVKREFDKHNIEIPFNQLVLHQANTGEEDSN